MPLILVVEQEQRYVERISEALSSYGWAVEGVHDKASALEFVVGQPASLVILNSEVTGSDELVGVFSRRAGGPGTVLLIPENADAEVARLAADEVVQKPFTAKAIRQAVRRCLTDSRVEDSSEQPSFGAGSGSSSKGARGKESGDGKATVAAAIVADASDGQVAGRAMAASPQPVSGGMRLTSEDIFGDVVSELESAFAMGTLAAVATAEAPAAQPVEAAPEPDAVVEAPIGLAAVAELEDVEPDEEALADEAIGAAAVATPVEAASEAAEEAEAEEDVAAAAEAGAEKEIEAVAEVAEALEEPVAPVPAARPDPAKILDERIRQAAAEGMRLSASSNRTVAPTRAASADDLLRHALSGLKRPQEPVVQPSRASDEEVEELLSSVVGKKRRAPQSAESVQSGETEPAQEAVEAVGVEGLDQDEVLEIMRGTESRGLATRSKLIWAIIIIVLLAVLAFVLAGRAGKDAASSQRLDAGSDAQVEISTGPSSFGDEAA